MRILLLIIFPLVSFTQDVAIGYWKDYLAYNQVTDLAVVNEKTYCIAPVSYTHLTLRRRG